MPECKISQNLAHRNRPAAAVLFLSALVLTLFTLATESRAFSLSPGIEQNRLRRLFFAVNQGQWPDSVLFRSEADGATVWFTSNGIIYQLYREKNSPSTTVDSPLNSEKSPQFECRLLRASFINANRNPVVTGEGLKEYKTNYFLGND